MSISNCSLRKTYSKIKKISKFVLKLSVKNVRKIVFIVENVGHETKHIFEMVAMPFPCNGILLIQGNLPRVVLGFT